MDEYKMTTGEPDTETIIMANNWEEAKQIAQDLVNKADMKWVRLDHVKYGYGDYI